MASTKTLVALLFVIHGALALRAGCKWSEKMSSASRPAGTKKAYTNTYDAERCKTLCENEKSFECSSVGIKDGYCGLKIGTSIDGYLLNREGNDFYEIQCEDDETPSKCPWRGPFIGRRLSEYHDLETIEDIDVEACQTRCKAEKRYSCKGLSYNKEEKVCVLSSASRYLQSATVPDGKFEYYELNCDDDIAQCDQEIDAGSGSKSKMVRWGYDAEKKECVQFSYKGSRGNENNFIGKEKCEAACGAKSMPAECLLPMDKGTGSKKTARFYFNSKSGKCKKFKFSGAGGNGNNFESSETCKKTCKI